MPKFLVLAAELAFAAVAVNDAPVHAASLKQEC